MRLVLPGGTGQVGRLLRRARAAGLVDAGFVLRHRTWDGAARHLVAEARALRHR